MIERYLAEVRWTPDGMDYPELNCWGLVRHARHELYGLPLLPAFGIHAGDKRAQTRAAEQVIHSCLIPAVTPATGDVVAVWRGRLCVHVALVIEVERRLAVLESRDGADCVWRWLPDWARRQTGVRVYRDNSGIPFNAAG